MKKLLFLFLILLYFGNINAQGVVIDFDSTVATQFFDTTSAGFFNNGAGKSVFDLSDYYADKTEGTGSLKLDYTIASGDDWGGFIVRATPVLTTYLDFSAGTELKFDYKVLTPADTTQVGDVFMEFKIGDVKSDDPSARGDLWYYVAPIDFFDQSAEWKNVSLPLVFGTDKFKEFALQVKDDDGALALDKLVKIEISLVYTAGGNNSNPPLASGSFLIDNLTIHGNRYLPLTNFDDAASTNFFAIDDMSWAGDGKSSVSLSDNSTDYVEGEASLQVDYTINASQDWGGFLKLSKQIETLPDSFANRTNLVFYVKNVTPHQGANPKRLKMALFIYENSTGFQEEEWISLIPINLSETSEWTRYVIPLKQSSMVGDSFPTDGFAQPSWNQSGDKVFDPKAMFKWAIEISAGGNDQGVKGEKMSGIVLFDVLQTSGLQTTDQTPPIAPEQVTVVQDNYSNLVTWADIPGEDNERYQVYTSKEPISDVTASGVEQIGFNITGDIQVCEHLLRVPIEDKLVSYYYAIYAVDKEGNRGDIAKIGPITNTAKGIPTVAIGLTNFQADGNLQEWQNIPHFSLKVSDGSLVQVTNSVITNDEDCSGDFWVAIDQEYFYFAAQVLDDIVYDDSADYASASWSLDAPDLYFGLYDISNFKQTNFYKSGTQPDYRVRFNKLLARNDHWDDETDSLLVNGTENYYWEETLLPAGYIIEARIPLYDLANKRDNPSAVRDIIYVTEGMRIPFDISLTDNDGLNNPDKNLNREGLGFWSPYNQDQGWGNPSVWMYTWIGSTDQITDVAETVIPQTFKLEQNFPNPFNPTTKINYSLPQAGRVSLRVYDILGRIVSELVNQQQAAGNYTIEFDASSLSTGVYLYKLESGSYSSTKKMMLIK